MNRAWLKVFEQDENYQYFQVETHKAVGPTPSSEDHNDVDNSDATRICDLTDYIDYLLT